MDKETRSKIERATQQARRLLEREFAEQLEGTYDIMLDGSIQPEGGAHLTPREHILRSKLVAAVEHKRAAGMKVAEAVADFRRDLSFTILNRFVALKMLEARDLVQECVSKGDQSSGFKEFCGLAPGLALLPDLGAYRLYLECLLDELSQEVKILFDRRLAASLLWPRRQALADLLAILNDTELSGVWREDETIGWVYQYFNSGEERREMRNESEAPRNSRELAIRNQFFTPRYVVEFLTDNSLGRTWYEMRQGRTSLTERCHYLMRRPDEVFLAAGEPMPAVDGSDAPNFVRFRPMKDPRDMKVLDPACGSGHFLLYAYELMLTIYEEAWEGETPASEATKTELRADYPDRDALRRAVPGLVLRYNMHGVDIDPRCAQIAALALWMRAQRAYGDYGIERADRPRIKKVNIVVAEPMPGEQTLLDEFVTQLSTDGLREHFLRLVETMRLAGDLGILLRLENFVARGPSGEQIGLFATPEAQILELVVKYAREAHSAQQTSRQLFADDTIQGLGLIELVQCKYDVVLMNPPFGESTDASTETVSRYFENWNKNILCAFIARVQNLMAPNGFCGTVVDRTINEKSTYEKFRRRYLLSSDVAVHHVADLGWGVLDANVEVAALVLGAASPDHIFLGFDVREAQNKEQVLRNECNPIPMRVKEASRLPNAVIGYYFPAFAIGLFDSLPSLREAGFDLFEGHTLKSERYFRLAWESLDGGRDHWTPLFNGTAYSRFAYPHHDLVTMAEASGANADRGTVIRNVTKHRKPGVCYGKRGEYVDAQLLPAGFISTVESCQ